jgi:hypothetical protein
MEAPHGNRNPSRAEWTCYVEGAGILIGLDANQRDASEIIVTPEARQQCRDVDTCVGLVDYFDVYGYVRTKHPTLSAISRDAVYGGKRIRWGHCPPPPDHVSVVVVVRRFDQDELKMSSHHHIGLQH